MQQRLSVLVDVVDVGLVLDERLSQRLLRENSIEKIQLAFQLEKSLEFWLEIPYIKKKFKNWLSIV